MRLNWRCPGALVTAGTRSPATPLRPWGQATLRSSHAAQEEKGGAGGRGGAVPSPPVHRWGHPTAWHGDVPANRGGQPPTEVTSSCTEDATAATCPQPVATLLPSSPCGRAPGPPFWGDPVPSRCVLQGGQEGDPRLSPSVLGDRKVLTGGLRGDTALTTPPTLRSQLWPPRPSTGAGDREGNTRLSAFLSEIISSATAQGWRWRCPGPSVRGGGVRAPPGLSPGTGSAPTAAACSAGAARCFWLPPGLFVNVYGAGVRHRGR